MRTGDRLFRIYVACVITLGLATLAGLLVARDVGALVGRPAVLAVLAFCTVLGEIRPVQILPRRQTAGGGGGTVTTSTTFAFAILLMAGPAVAAVTLAAASLMADAIHRKAVHKALFNLAQYTLSVAGAGLVLRLLASSTPLVGSGRVEGDDLLPLAAAIVTFFVVNNMMISAVVALFLRAPLLSHVAQVLRYQAPIDGLLLGMAPVVVVVADQNLGLIPFLLLPVTAVYMSTQASLEKEHQALHDALTGLPNRALFHDVVDEALGRAGDGVTAAVMLIDLDRFKEINDTLGHHIGDRVLREVGPRLQESLRTQDVVARLGGDEFAIFVEDADPTVARDIVERVLTGLSVALTVEELSLHVDGSIGIALYPDHGQDVDTLLQRADVAMYAAKEEHSGYQVYSPDRDPYSLRRLTLLSELRGAVERGELVLHFQPKADLRTGRVTDAEALVRWNHPTLGMVPPNDFVPLAERSGLIGPLTEHVLRQAVGRAAEWRRRGIDLRVSVNLSVHNLMDAGLPQLVEQVLAAHAVDASVLELEITETTIMTDPMRALRVLQPLSDMGVRLSIDDFGTGYSSLAYLRQLPISEIKIDRSFIAGMESSENDAIIVRSTIDLARNLGLEVVAEGVETAEGLATLEAMHCDYIQGYYLSRPVPAEELPSRLGQLAAFWPDAVSVSS
jgi:diguanylate cyclase (GGDEF)-like protein